jgi:hypothetical protein
MHWSRFSAACGVDDRGLFEMEDLTTDATPT